MTLSSFPIALLLGSVGARVSGMAGSGNRVLNRGAAGAPHLVWHAFSHSEPGINMSSFLQLCHKHIRQEVTDATVVDLSNGLGYSVLPLSQFHKTIGFLTPSASVWPPSLDSALSLLASCSALLHQAPRAAGGSAFPHALGLCSSSWSTVLLLRSQRTCLFLQEAFLDLHPPPSPEAPCASLALILTVLLPLVPSAMSLVGVRASAGLPTIHPASPAVSTRLIRDDSGIFAGLMNALMAVGI